MPFNAVFSHIIKRRLPRIQRFSEAPLLCQNETLKFLVDNAKETVFGDAYNFHSIRSIKSFQDRVPLSNYDSLKPYIDRELNGEENVLWPGKTNWFAKSSGTTLSRQKLLPITVDSLYENHYAGGKDLLAMYYQNFQNRKLYNAKHLIVGGSTQINSLSNDTSIGDLSALIVENLPWWTEIRRAPKREIALMNDWAQKLDKMAKATIKENICIVVGLPSWTLLLMHKILDISGKKNIHEVWPNLELYIHGGMNIEPYRKAFEQIFPNPKMNYVEAYNASEGYFGFQDQIDSNDLLLLCDSHIFFEFIPMSEFNEINSKTVLSLKDVEIGQEYAIVISTSAGLWRHIIGDTIKFVNKSPFRFNITGRTSQYINAFGEKLIVSHAENAVAEASNLNQVKIIDYTVAPFFTEHSGIGGHEWAIAFKDPPEDLEKFKLDLDHFLKIQNGDYQGKRDASINMALPKVNVVHPSTFENWLKKKNKLGGQHKIPRLKQDRLFLEEIHEISNKMARNSYIY